MSDIPTFVQKSRKYMEIGFAGRSEAEIPPERGHSATEIPIYRGWPV